MGRRFQIGGYWYQTRMIRGRQFFNGVEQGVIVHHDRGVIEISDKLSKEKVAEQVGTAVAESWIYAVEHGELPHAMPGIANAGFDGPGSEPLREQ